MDIRQLRYFLTIAKEGQITRAAQKLNMAQPPLSQQLKLIEDELGTKLFERIGRSIELTQAGKILYKKGDHILHLLEDAITEIKETGDGLRGELGLGTIRSYALTFLSQRIFDFRQQFPNTSFKILEGDPFQLGQLLQNRDIELAIVRSPVHLDIEINKISLQVEPYYLCVPTEWKAFHERTHVSMLDIEDLPFMALHRNNGEGAYESMINECKRFGFTPNIICQCPDATILLSMVAAGVGATILQRSTLFLYPSNKIRSLEILDCSLRAESALIWSKERPLSNLASRFIETFQH